MQWRRQWKYRINILKLRLKIKDLVNRKCGYGETGVNLELFNKLFQNLMKNT